MRFRRHCAAAVVGALMLTACSGESGAQPPPTPTRGSMPVTDRDPAAPSTANAPVETGSDPSPGTVPADVRPPSDGELAIRWVTRWWDPAVDGYGPPVDDIAVFADGTVVGASTVDFEAQPMVWPYVTGSIPVADVASLLEAAGELGLLDFGTAFEIGGANPDVLAAPVTFVTLRTATGEVTHAVHALQTPSDPEIVGGWELRTLIADVQERTAAALDPLTAPVAEPSRVAVMAVPIAAPGDVPADAWSGGVALGEAAPCAVTDEPDTIADLRTRLAGERFSDGGATFTVRAYQLIPGELFCFGSVPSAERPRSAADVIRMSVPSSPATGPSVGAGPDVVVYPDGTVLARYAGVFEAEPMVWPYHVGRIDRGTVVAWLDQAEAAGLLTEPLGGTLLTDTVDDPLITVMLRDWARSVTHQVTLAEPAATETPAARAVRELTDAVAAEVAAVRAAEQPQQYQPKVLAIASTPAADEHGDALPWPGAWPPAGYVQCTLVSDPVIIADLLGRLSGQRYKVDGVTYSVVARVAFPNDLSC